MKQMCNLSVLIEESVIEKEAAKRSDMTVPEVQALLAN